MTDTRPAGARPASGTSPRPEAVWPADPGGVNVPGDAGHEDPPPRRTGGGCAGPLNREAVVDALLDLYAEGNLRPGTDEIAERAGISPRSLFRYFEDADDLAGEAVARQLARALPLVDRRRGARRPLRRPGGRSGRPAPGLFATVGQAARCRGSGRRSSPDWPQT